MAVHDLVEVGVTNKTCCLLHSGLGDIRSGDEILHSLRKLLDFPSLRSHPMKLACSRVLPLPNEKSCRIPCSATLLLGGGYTCSDRVQSLGGSAKNYLHCAVEGSTLLFRDLAGL